MSEQFINPVWDVLPPSIDDSSIHQYEMVRYDEVNGRNITQFGGPTYKIVTKDLDSYLLPQKGYLDIVLRIAENDAGDLTTDSTQLHSNVLAVLQKCSYYVNSVPVEEVEYPVLTSTVKNLLEYSQDYLDKQGPMQWFYKEIGNGAFAAADPRVTRLQDGAGKAKRVRVLIPLNRIFNFMDSYGSAMRGLEHRFELIKEERVGNFIFGPAGGAADRVIFDEMSVWLPKLLPSPMAEQAYLTSIKSGDSAIVNYESWNGYRATQQAGTLLTWQIQATAKKPKYVFCSFQRAPRLNTVYDATTQNVNPGVYDNLSVQLAELRVNSKRFPLERYQLDFTAPTAVKADQYARAYKDFLRIMDADMELDNGSLVSYDDYRDRYAILAFDLSNDHSLFENVQTNYIELNVTFAVDPAAQYYSNAVVVWDRALKLGSDGDRLNIIRE